MLNIESVNLMQLTIDLAKMNLAKNKIPVAAIIVDGQTNEIIAKATNDNSPIGHAELKAIKKAEELAPLAKDRKHYAAQKEMLYGENAAINLNHGPAHMLKNSKEFEV